MKISWIKIVWFTVSLIISGVVAYHAYQAPMKFVPFTDLLATIISILIGMSLAISAILSTRPKLSDQHYQNEGEKKRLEKLLKKDDIKLQDGQFILFWFYYTSLILAVVLKFLGIEWAGANQSQIDASIILKIASASFVFIACLSLLWSATLPSLFKKVSNQRVLIEY